MTQQNEPYKPFDRKAPLSQLWESCLIAEWAEKHHPRLHGAWARAARTDYEIARIHGNHPDKDEWGFYGRRSADIPDKKEMA